MIVTLLSSHMQWNYINFCLKKYKSANRQPFNGITGVHFTKESSCNRHKGALSRWCPLPVTAGFLWHSCYYNIAHLMSHFSVVPFVMPCKTCLFGHVCDCWIVRDSFAMATTMNHMTFTENHFVGICSDTCLLITVDQKKMKVLGCSGDYYEFIMSRLSDSPQESPASCDLVITWHMTSVTLTFRTSSWDSCMLHLQ